jgi:putative tricarboxylic transport membrane protein
MTRGLSDRIAGAILLALAIWFWWQAANYRVAFGDWAGPSLFPRIVAVPLALFSLVLILRPDPNPSWFRWPAVARQAVALVVLFGYPQIIQPLGFPAATFLAVLPLAVLFGATWLQGVVAGLGISVSLYFIFDGFFGLPLPLGPLFG